MRVLQLESGVLNRPGVGRLGRNAAGQVIDIYSNE